MVAPRGRVAQEETEAHENRQRLVVETAHDASVLPWLLHSVTHTLGGRFDRFPRLARLSRGQSPSVTAHVVLRRCGAKDIGVVPHGIQPGPASQLLELRRRIANEFLI